MADSPLLDSDGVLAVAIKLAGKALDDAVEIVSVRVERALNGVPAATVVLGDGSVAENAFPFMDGNASRPGTQIEIAAGWGGNAGQVLFNGIVTAARLRVSETPGPQVELTCRDRAIRLQGVRRTATWHRARDADVMQAIIGDAGLAGEVAATAGPATDVVQYDCSDWDFLRLLADRNGLVLDVGEGRIAAVAPDPSVAARLTLTLGVDLLDLDVRIDAAPLEAAAQVTGWDPGSQSTQVARAAAESAGAWGNSRLSDLAAVTGDRVRAATVPYADGQPALATVAAARAGRRGRSRRWHGAGRRRGP